MHTCSSGEGLLSEGASQSRVKSEHAWARFKLSASASKLPAIVWNNDWDNGLPCILAHFVAGEITETKCQDSLQELYRVGCGIRAEALECQCGTSKAVSDVLTELHLWHASWQRSSSSNVTSVDLCNDFGWHALPSNDPVWASDAFRDKWIAIGHSGCRGRGDRLPVANGPLDRASELMVATARILPPGYSLVSVTGSGTEARTQSH